MLTVPVLVMSARALARDAACRLDPGTTTDLLSCCTNPDVVRAKIIRGARLGSASQATFGHSVVGRRCATTNGPPVRAVSLQPFNQGSSSSPTRGDKQCGKCKVLTTYFELFTGYHVSQTIYRAGIAPVLAGRSLPSQLMILLAQASSLALDR